MSVHRLMIAVIGATCILPLLAGGCQSSASMQRKAQHGHIGGFWQRRVKYNQRCGERMDRTLVLAEEYQNRRQVELDHTLEFIKQRQQRDWDRWHQKAPVRESWFKQWAIGDPDNISPTWERLQP